MRQLTRHSRVVLLAIVLVGACGPDEPAPQHPTHKKHKKHDDSDVVVADDTDAGDSDAKPKKKHHKTADSDAADADSKHDDDKPKKKHHKADSDDADAKRDDDKPKTKHRKVAEKSDDDDATKKTDDDKPTKSHHKAAKKSDDDADATKDDSDAHAKIAERTPKKATKRKHAAAPKAPTTEKKEDAASAEIEIDDAPPAPAAEQPTAEATSTEDEAAPASVAAPMPAPAPATSPLAINDRALITHTGGLEVHGGLRTAVLTLPGVMPGTSTSSTSEGLALGATYGVADKAEIGADYVLSLHPGAVKGPLTFHGAYLALASGKLDVAVAGALAVDFQDSTDPTTGKTTTTTSYGLQLGGWVRYRVAPKVALFTGLPALPASTASLSKLSFALPPLPYQLAIGLSSGSTIALDLPAGVGFQATPVIYAFAMTNLAHVKISNSQNAFLFKDFIPLTVGGFYTHDKLDLGATFADDLKQGFGYLSFELLARYAL